jgi:hypothetical protein
MIATARLAELVVGSRSPRHLAGWYRWALGVAPGTGLRVNRGMVVARSAVEPMRMIANLTVANLMDVEARLIAMESVWARPVERRPCGIIGTIVDPDGNYVQVLQR